MADRMPVVFTGHGYPMNAITDSPARDGWKRLGAALGKPAAIVAITGHWQTSGQCVRIANDNPFLYDVWDIPEETFNMKYSPVGSPRHLMRVKELLGDGVFDDNTWGIGHALWVPLSNMYPDADVPVVLLSTDVDSAPCDALELGRKLSPLRDEGVLIFCSGNIVHEVDMVDQTMKDGLPWAIEFNDKIKELTLSRRTDELLNYKNIPHHELAVPTVDHYYPFLTAYGASSEDNKITVFNDYCELASLSMTSYMFG